MLARWKARQARPAITTGRGLCVVRGGRGPRARALRLRDRKGGRRPRRGAWVLGGLGGCHLHAAIGTMLLLRGVGSSTGAAPEDWVCPQCYCRIAALDLCMLPAEYAIPPCQLRGGLVVLHSAGRGADRGYHACSQIAGAVARRSAAIWRTGCGSSPGAPRTDMQRRSRV